MQRVVGLFLAANAVFGCGLVRMPGGPPATNPVAGYVIEVSEGGGDVVEIAINQEGDGCERLLPDSSADRTCRIATLLNPWTIGGEAYGELNIRHTPTFDALVWRARIDADAAVCARGGLQGDLLAKCEESAAATDYLYEAGELQIRVPVGGAVPASSA